VAETLRLEVATPTRQVVDEQVDTVELPGILGGLGVLPGHTPLLTAIGTGPLLFRREGTESLLAIQGGFAEVLGDRVTVLAAIAERPDEIDVEAAERDKAEAQAALKDAAAEQLKAASDRLRLAEARLEVAGRA
jgi:F-type H+-transporting ATPase subunit epsilon